MGDLPVILRVAGRRCTIVGGGKVALRRATSLLQCGAIVTVIAPEIDEAFAPLPLRLDRRAYQRDDLAGVFLVVIATNSTPVNEAVAAEARARGVLINRTDDAEEGDVAIPAYGQVGPVTVAVHTGVSASAAATIRRELTAAMDPDWPRLLQTAAPFRELIRSRYDDPALRRQKLKALAGPKAMGILKAQGPDALRLYCVQLLDEPAGPVTPCDSGAPCDDA